MSEIAKIFDNVMLDDLFDVRSDGVSSMILKSNNFDEKLTVENDLLNTIEKLITNDEIKKQIFEKLQNYEDSISEEMYLLNKNFYKIGIVDGINLTKEASEIMKELKKKQK